jgi:hypothetical protein
MLPALAQLAITTYTDPGGLVLDPMCGIGTTLVEAVHEGRDAVGVEYEQRWAALARDNISHAVDHGATGHAAVAVGDARHAAALLGPDLTGRVDLLLTSPPYGSSVHGQVEALGDQPVRKWDNRYGPRPSRAHRGRGGRNLADESLTDLLDGFRQILTACLPLLRPGAHVVITTRPWRRAGRLIDFPTAVLDTATAAGLLPVTRHPALLCAIRDGRPVTRASFFQLTDVRRLRNLGLPVQVISHEDAVVLRVPGKSAGGTGRDPASSDGVVERTGGDARGTR